MSSCRRWPRSTSATWPRTRPRSRTLNKNIFLVIRKYFSALCPRQHLGQQRRLPAPPAAGAGGAAVRRARRQDEGRGQGGHIRVLDVRGVRPHPARRQGFRRETHGRQVDHFIFSLVIADKRCPIIQVRREPGHLRPRPEADPQSCVLPLPRLHRGEEPRVVRHLRSGAQVLLTTTTSNCKYFFHYH